MLSESLVQALTQQMLENVRQGHNCMLCNNPGQIAVIPGPPDQLRLMQVLPESHLGRVHGVGFLLCPACLSENGADALVKKVGDLMTGKATPLERPKVVVPVAGVVELSSRRKKEL